MNKGTFWLLGIALVLVRCQFLTQQATPVARNPIATELPVPTVTSLPKYLGVVVPEPGSVYSLAEYEKLAPSYGWKATLPGICMSFEPVWLLEPGDFPSAEEWLSQVHLVVDGAIITKHHSLLLTDTLGLEEIDPETNQVILREPDGSPLMVCYAVELDVGPHTATVVIQKTSGEEVIYTWPFTITEQ